MATLAFKKGFLREAASSVLRDLLLLVPGKALAAVLASAPAAEAWLCAPLESADASTVFLAVSLWDRLPASLLPRCVALPGPAMDKAALFERTHLAALLPALLTASSTHPRMHSCWGALLALLPRDAETEAASAQAVALWEVVCEGGLFSSSHERKSLGFELFSRLVPRCSAAVLPSLFSHDFMRCLVNSLSNEATLLHSAAARCLQKLLAHVQSAAGEELQAAVVAALQRFGGGRFDALTHTDTVAQLMASLSGESVEQYVASLKAAFLRGTTLGEGPGAGAAASVEGKAADGGVMGRRIWAADQLCGVFRSSGAMPAVQAAVLRFMAAHSFFDLEQPVKANKAATEPEELRAAPEPPLSAATREALAVRLMGLAADVAAAEALRPEAASADAQRRVKAAAVAAARQAGGKSKATEGPAPAEIESAAVEAGAEAAAAAQRRAEEAATTFAELAQFCAVAERLRSLAVPQTAEASAARKAARACLAWVEGLGHGADGQRQKVAAARQLLQALLLLQLSAPAEEAGVMADVPIALQRALQPGEATRGADEPHHMDVLLDALLALLTRSPSVVRDACERAFRAFCGELTPTGMATLLRVVCKTGSRRVRDGDEDDSGSEEEDEEDEEEDEEEKEEEEGEQGADGARAAAEQEEEEESDGDGMDDDAMFAMDGALTAVLSASSAAKRDKKVAVEVALHFRFRALSLLEAFMRSHPSSPLLPTTVLPLLRALATAAAGPAASPPLAQRVRLIFSKTLCRGPATLEWGAAAGVPPSGEVIATLRDSFSACLRQASRSSLEPVNKAAAAGCQYLLRVIASAGDGDCTVSAELLGGALVDYLTSKKCRLPQAFFTSAFEKLPKTGARMAALLAANMEAPAKANTGRAEHQAVECVKLLAAATRSVKPGTPAASELLSPASAAAVLRGLAAALGRPAAKAKRQKELLKALAGVVETLTRLAHKTGATLPAAEVSALRAATCAALAAAAAAEGAGPPKAKGLLMRMQEALLSSSGAAPKKRKKTEAGGGAKVKKGGAEKAVPGVVGKRTKRQQQTET